MANPYSRDLTNPNASHKSQTSSTDANYGPSDPNTGIFGDTSVHDPAFPGQNMRSKPQFKDYSPEVPKSKADADYKFSLEGSRKMTSVGNAVAGNALAKVGSTAMDWAVKPGGWRAA